MDFGVGSSFVEDLLAVDPDCHFARSCDLEDGSVLGAVGGEL
jgi:hypothetical protein